MLLELKRLSCLVNRGDRLVAVGWVQAIDVLCVIHTCSWRKKKELMVSI